MIVIGKLAKYVGKADLFASKISSQKYIGKLDVDAYKLFAKSFSKTMAKAEPETGRILRKQNAKGGRVLKAESVPTQQAIDNSFNVNFSRMEKVNKDGGFYDRKKVLDALVGFKHGTPIEHVKIESVPTLQAIEKLNNIKLVEQLKEAEALGQLTPEMLAKRKDVLAALNNSWQV